MPLASRRRAVHVSIRVPAGRVVVAGSKQRAAMATERKPLNGSTYSSRALAGGEVGG